MRLNETIIQKSTILETIIQKIEKDFPNDISVLVCYGSFITGKMHKYSDIDFFFIPKTEKGYRLSFQFIINGIGYDLWPISWKRAGNIFKLEEPLRSIFTKGKVLYFSTKDDLQRYEDLLVTLKTHLQDNANFSLISNSSVKKEKIQPSLNSLVGFYEELKSIYNKLKFACETKDSNLALYGAQIIDRETSEKLKPFVKISKFPSLTKSVSSGDFDEMKDNSCTHEKMLLKLLEDLNVPLNVFDTEKEFKKAIDQRI